MKKRKYILVLSGGGAKGAFQVGALKYMYEHGFYHEEEHILGDQIHFDYIAGVSAGSLNAGLIAMDRFKVLEELWTNEIAGHPENVWTSDFVDANLKPKDGLLKRFLPKIGVVKVLGLLFSKKQKKQLGKEILDKILEIESFASNAPLAKKLDEVMDVSKIQNTSLRVGYVSLESGEYHTIKHSNFDDNKEFKQAILASASMPVVWSPVGTIKSRGDKGESVEHRILVDGGIRNVSPLGDIIGDINANYDPETDYFVIIINNHNGTLSPSNGKKQNFLTIAYRSLVDITLNEIFVNDIQEFIRINSLVHQVDEAKKQGTLSSSFELKKPNSQQPFRKFYYKIVQPEEFIGTTLDFSKKRIDDRITHGYEVAKKVFGSETNDSLADGSTTNGIPWLV